MMNIDQLTESALIQYQKEMSQRNTVINRRIEANPLEDGSLNYTSTDIVGPVEVDIEKMRPLMRALAKAFINHLKNNAVVTVSGQDYHIR